MKTVLFFGALVIVLFTACNPQRNVRALVYFNDIVDSASLVAHKAETLIQPGDRLVISIGALNPESVAPYNFSAANAAGYYVETDGFIQLPQLGRFKVASKTRKEVVENLTSMLAKYVKDPIVTVQLINFQVTVLGDVSSPGVKNIAEGKSTLLDAIGLAGDLAITGRRDNILVIRDRGGERQFGRVNLTSSQFFYSQFFTLKQNDVIYVEPTKSKLAQAGDQSFMRNLTVASTVIGVVTAVAFLIISLTR